jgi:hypothetical protein
MQRIAISSEPDDKSELDVDLHTYRFLSVISICLPYYNYSLNLSPHIYNLRRSTVVNRSLEAPEVIPNGVVRILGSPGLTEQKR